jgi:hypothetical protein
MIKRIILNIAAIVCLQQVVIAQNNNSPYSIYGIGDIEQSSFDRTSGMGHAGMALSSNRFLYNANPASLSGLDDKFFNFEMTARAKYINYSGDPITSSSGTSSDLQIKKMSLALKIKPKWGVSLGLLPFSSANYSFYSNKNIAGAGNVTVPAYYQGSGSINQFYLSNSYKLFKNFSIGLQSSYLFGQFNQTESIISSFVTDSGITTTRKNVISSFYFKPGFQFNTKLNSNVSVYFGGTATFKTSLDGVASLSVTDGGGTVPTPQNTIIENYKSTPFTLPSKYSGSIAAKVNEKYTFSVDYSFQNWNSQNVQGITYKLVNSSFIGAGIEIAKIQKFRDISIERHFWQAGVFRDNSYLQINGQQVSTYGITFGGGKNFLRSNLGLQINTELGVRGMTTGGMIQENYAQLNVILSYRDFWFVKVKRFD